MRFIPIPESVVELQRELQRRREQPDAKFRVADDAMFLRARLAVMTPGELDAYDFVSNLEIARLKEEHEALLEQVASDPEARALSEWIDANFKPGENLRGFCERTGENLGELLIRFARLRRREDLPLGRQKPLYH